MEDINETEKPAVEKQDISNFHFFSLGHVAANKPRNTWVIEVTPTEKLPMLDGEVTDNVEEVEVKGRRDDGTEYASSSLVGQTIQATWLPYSDPNRITAPDVRRGMTVMIVRFGDSKQYFWCTVNDIKNLMRLETVTHVFNADPGNASDPAKDNCYIVEVSTHDKHYMIRTTKKNGEKAAYTLILSGANGQAYLSDDDDNQFMIDSTNQIVEMRNANGALIQLNKDDVYKVVPGNYYEDIQGNKISKVRGSSTEDVDGSISSTSKGPRNVNAAGINHASTGDSTSTSTGVTRIGGSEVHLG